MLRLVHLLGTCFLLLALSSAELIIFRAPIIIGRDYDQKIQSSNACQPFGKRCIDFSLCDESTIMTTASQPDGQPVHAISGHDNRVCPDELQVCCEPNLQIVEALLDRYSSFGQDDDPLELAAPDNEIDAW